MDVLPLLEGIKVDYCSFELLLTPSFCYSIAIEICVSVLFVSPGHLRHRRYREYSSVDRMHSKQIDSYQFGIRIAHTYVQYSIDLMLRCKRSNLLTKSFPFPIVLVELIQCYMHAAMSRSGT